MAVVAFLVGLAFLSFVALEDTRSTGTLIADWLGVCVQKGRVQCVDGRTGVACDAAVA